MPGKQMAIDADLNAGILSNEEARQRREEITQEADFYGAMDGASKFVKGDAIAGILILIINIIGGLIVGLAQHDLTLNQRVNPMYFYQSVMAWLPKSRLVTGDCNSDYCYPVSSTRYGIPYWQAD